MPPRDDVVFPCQLALDESFRRWKWHQGLGLRRPYLCVEISAQCRAFSVLKSLRPSFICRTLGLLGRIQSAWRFFVRTVSALPFSVGEVLQVLYLFLVLLLRSFACLLDCPGKLSLCGESLRPLEIAARAYLPSIYWTSLRLIGGGVGRLCGLWRARLHRGCFSSSQP